MYALITAVHISACVVLVLVVLLQTGKGADIGAVFGGSSTTIFGSTGAGNFLTKVTTGAAITFMLTSLLLTYGALHKTSESVVPETPVASVPASQPAPVQLPPTGGAETSTDAAAAGAGGGEAAAGASAPSGTEPAEPAIPQGSAAQP